MEEEIWKSIEGYEKAYQAGSSGNIKSIGKGRGRKTGRILKSKKVDGYMTVCLYRNKKRNVFMAHRIIAMVFLDYDIKDTTFVIDHIDGNVSNNAVSNLRITTQRYNCSYGYRKDRQKMHSKYPGVSWHNKANKWIAQIYHHGKNENLGLFLNEADAYDAYKSRLLNL